MKKLYLLSVFILLCAAAFAGGETAGDVLKLKTGGRPLGMGGAYTAAGDNVEVINYNPAGISLITKREISYMHWISYAEIQVAHASYAQPVETAFIEGKAGISLVYRFLPVIDNEDAEDEPVEYYDMVITGTFANTLDYFVKGDTNKYINLGISVKVLIEQVSYYQGSTVCFDAGAMFTPPESPFKLGIALQNIGPGIKFIEEESPLPLILRGGASAEWQVDKDNLLTLAADYIQDFYDTGNFAVGFEDRILNLLSFRAGYGMSFDENTPSYLSAGAGISAHVLDIAVVINYAYQPYIWDTFETSDHTHIFSMLVRL